jgi:putative ABC transport system permease protein
VNWILHDVRYALRRLRRQPGFVLLVVLELGLGVGAATTIFSVIDNILLNPFPYKDADRVVTISIHDLSNSRRGGRSYFPLEEFLEYQNQNHVFQEVIGTGGEDVLYFNGQGTEQFNGSFVTPNTFRFLGVPAQLGRFLEPDDAKPGAPPVFVMSYHLWATRFSRDASLLGQNFTLNGVRRTLVGVMPLRFTKQDGDVYYPASLDRADPDNAGRYFLVQGRLKPGVTFAQAQADITVVAQRLAAEYPKNYPKQFSVQIMGWVERIVGQFSKSLYTLAVAVGLLLLIACSNVSNMLLAQATAREKEMSVRAALGASRWRLVRQLLVESFVLALGGAAVGCLLAYGGIKALVAFIPQDSIPHEAVIALNVPVLLFSLALAVFTPLLFGLAPALHAVKRDVVEPLKGTGKGVGGGFRHAKLRNSMIVVEVVLSLVLLAGAGLLMRTFVSLQTVDLGFDPANVLFARFPFPHGQYTTAAAKQQFFRALLPRLTALPGVVAVTETTTLPPYGGLRSEIDVPGKTHYEKWTAIFQLVSEGYFPTLRIRLLRGRALSDVEVNDARKVAVVNQTLVRRFFGDQDPLGQHVKINFLQSFPPDSPMPDPTFEIVGVVADVKNQGVQDPPLPEIFIPYTLTGAFDRGVLVRTARDPLPLLDTVRRQIWAVDSNVATTDTDTLENYLKRFSYSEPCFSLILLGVFAGVGLILVSVGVYSVMAYTVSVQTHEIGIRMALGAGAAHVFRMVLWAGLRLIAVGVAVGLAASFAATWILASQLWGVSPRDPLTLSLAAAIIMIAGLAACYFPARRATRVDPVIALRYE